MQEPLGVRLRRLREAKGYTQRQLGEPRYTSPFVSLIEAGKRKPSRTALAHFAERLGVDLEELITGRRADVRVELDLRLHEAFLNLYRGNYAAADTTFRRIIQHASHDGFVRIQARAEEGRGVVAERRGRPEAALRHFERAERLLEQEPLALKAEAVAGRARAVQMLGDVRYAIHLLELYLIALREEPAADPLALMRTYSALVWPYSEAGLYRRASDVARQALHLEAHVENAEQIAHMHMNVARELLRSGRADDALRSLQRADDLFRQLDLRTEVAGAHLNMGIVLVDQGQLDDGRREIETALEVFRECSSTRDQARALNELARAERLSGRLDSAKELLQQSIRLLREGDIAELALAHREMGLSSRDEPRVAERHLRKAVDLYKRLDRPAALAETYGELGDVVAAQGSIQSAYQLCRDGLMAISRSGSS